MIFEKYKNENGIPLSESIKDNFKSSIEAISMDNSGQGAAEYILLFGYTSLLLTIPQSTVIISLVPSAASLSIASQERP